MSYIVSANIESFKKQNNAMKQNKNLRTGVILALGVWAAACSDSSPSSFNQVSTGAAASLQASAGATAQSAVAGSAVAVAPSVVVKDANGNVLPGATVNFVVTAGGGSVANSVAITNMNGIATSGAWTLGSQGTNSVEARVGSLVPVKFTATGVANTPVASGYAITIRYLTATPTPRQQLAVTNAVARWQSVITRDLADIPVNASVNACWDGQPAFNERIDDILIFVEFVDIDGAGKILGEAGPCFVRSDNQLPVVGHLKLDAADLRQMEVYGTLDDVVLHEIGHVLGIGTMWQDKSLLLGKGTEDPTFLGANAVSAYRTMGGTAATVPVENTGGEGTRDGHWRETTFGNELMTGWVSGGSNPLSALTIASLNDLGYGANASAASGYTLGGGSGRAFGMELGDEVIKKPKYKIDRNGKKADL
jgi:hypothetical protein